MRLMYRVTLLAIGCAASIPRSTARSTAASVVGVRWRAEESPE
jgi:hypothetical protein